MQTPTTALAAVIRAAADNANVAQATLAAALGLPKTTMHRKYHGHIPYSYPEMVTVAGLLGTSVEQLHADASAAA